MSNRWHLVNTPPALLYWILEQPQCLGTAPDGVVTIAMAVYPDRLLWAVSVIDPNNPSSQVWYTTYCFRVDHQTNTLTFTHTTRSRAQ